jgi:bis(5'-nucleosyl)-tetraphosphatase (symmetrical)
MYGNQPDVWQEGLTGWERLRFITNCFTRLRYCDANGKLALKEKGAPGTQATPYQPWFRVSGRQSSNDRIFFGHWSTLGVVQEHNVISLDCGCVWGGSLAAYCIDTGAVHRIACAGTLVPGAL